MKRPIVRYHGGKWRIAPWIISHFLPHRIYVEPFGGGGGVLLRKARSYAEVYNDLDAEIVNVFRMTRDAGEELKRLLTLTPFSRDEFRESYNRSSDPIEQARRTIARSFMGYGSNAVSAEKGTTGFRSNSNRSGTTPAHDWKNYADVFDLLIDRLRGVVIENRDAKEVMAKHDGPDTLHYVDPPYVLATRASPRHGYRHEMTDFDHEELADFLGKLKGAVVLSGYASPLYEGLFRQWQRIETAARADGAQHRTEVLWLNDQAAYGDLV